MSEVGRRSGLQYIQMNQLHKRREMEPDRPINITICVALRASRGTASPEKE